MATDEGSLLAAARAEGKVLVAPGAVIALTMPLRLCEEADDWQRERNHCCLLYTSPSPRDRG